MADPQGELLGLPPGYGTPSRALPWDEVRARLEEACWFGGRLETVEHRSLMADGRATLHLADPEAAVIVEGVSELGRPAADTADRLVQASKRKYGYAPPAAAYAEGSGACGLGR